MKILKKFQALEGKKTFKMFMEHFKEEYEKRLLVLEFGVDHYDCNQSFEIIDDIPPEDWENLILDIELDINDQSIAFTYPKNGDIEMVESMYERAKYGCCYLIVLPS